MHQRLAQRGAHFLTLPYYAMLCQCTLRVPNMQSPLIEKVIAREAGTEIAPNESLFSDAMVGQSFTTPIVV